MPNKSLYLLAPEVREARAGVARVSVTSRRATATYIAWGGLSRKAASFVIEMSLVARGDDSLDGRYESGYASRDVRRDCK